jgi:hypothetical protein
LELHLAHFGLCEKAGRLPIKLSSCHWHHLLLFPFGIHYFFVKSLLKLFIISKLRQPLRRHYHRHLDWEGCYNARDLGGLRTASGEYIRLRSLVRAENLDLLTEPDWNALYEYGVRTIIDLRNDDERQAELQKPGHHEDLIVLHLPHDGEENVEFWGAFARGPEFGSTPLY